MTRDEILFMPAGRQLDELVAIHLMKDFGYIGGIIPFGVLRPYSTDVSAAWDVVTRFAKEPSAWSIESINTTYGVKWDVELWDGDHFANSVCCASFPLAVCRAALLTVLEIEKAGSDPGQDVKR